MKRSFNLIEHVLVSPSQDDGASSWFFTSFEKNKIIISNSLL